MLGLLGATASGLTSFFLPSYYRSGATFQAEANTPPQLSGALAGLASQFGGLQLAGGQSNPYLFADLITSDAVLNRVARASFPWRGGSATLVEIYGYHDEPESWGRYKTTAKLRKAMQVNINVRPSTVRFSVEARTPDLAAAIAETTLAALNEANIALRQARAAAEQNFTTDRSQHARAELATAESALTRFYERNRVITQAPGLQMEEARLKRAVEMTQQVYVQLRLQAEQAAIQAVRNTPAISVVDPPMLPVKRSRPRRSFAIAVGFAIGLMVAGTRLVLRR
jgi:uncharacterized protein involved in exopolysaccharide biosynthesis